MIVLKRQNYIFHILTTNININILFSAFIQKFFGKLFDLNLKL